METVWGMNKMETVWREKPSMKWTSYSREEARPKLTSHLFLEILYTSRQWPENVVEIIAGKVVEVDDIFRRVSSGAFSHLVSRSDDVEDCEESVWSGGTSQVCNGYGFWAKAVAQICYGFFCCGLRTKYHLLLFIQTTTTTKTLFVPKINDKSCLNWMQNTPEPGSC